jgi:hypothetical protein
LSDIPIWTAWLQVAKRLLSNYEELTEYDDYLIERYRDPGAGEDFFPVLGDDRHRAPAELVRDVSRAHSQLFSRADCAAPRSAPPIVAAASTELRRSLAQLVRRAPGDRTEIEG